MMTVAAIMAGLLPIMWSHGTGAEVMQRIAVPMIGGMVSSTALTLIVIPAIYAVVKGFGLASQGPSAQAQRATTRLASVRLAGRLSRTCRSSDPRERERSESRARGTSRAWADYRQARHP